MWKLVYLPTCRFCVDADGADLVFATEGDALTESDNGFSHNYRPFEIVDPTDNQMAELISKA